MKRSLGPGGRWVSAAEAEQGQEDQPDQGQQWWGGGQLTGTEQGTRSGTARTAEGKELIRDHSDQGGN